MSPDALTTPTPRSPLPSAPVLVAAASAWRPGPLLRAVVSIASVIVLWQLGAMVIGGHPASVPTPGAVARSLWRDRSLYGTDLPPTLASAGLGYGIGCGSAIVLGAAIAALPVGRREAMAAMVALYNLPVIAVAPLLQILLPGRGPEIATAAIAVFFITLLATAEGLLGAEAAALDVVRAAGGGRPAATRLVRIWYALPKLAGGLGLAVPFALVGAILGEFLGGHETGLGVMLVGALSNLDAARVWAICLVIGLIGAAGVGAQALAVRTLMPWGAGHVDLRARRADTTRAGSAVRSLASVAVTVGVLLGLWVGGLAALHLSPYLARTPGDIWRYLVSGAGAGGHRRAVLGALGTTFGQALLGCAIGLGAGVAAAVAVARWAALRAAVLPFVVVLSSVPHLALVPMLALVLGHGVATALVVAALIALLPTIVGVEAALRATPSAFHDLMRVQAAGRWRTLISVELPYALPSVFTALRIAAPWSLLGVLYAEWLATGSGIGAQMVQQSVLGNEDAAWSAALVVTAAAVVLYLIVDLLERCVRGSIDGSAVR